MVERKWIKKMPKVELHCHLDGSISPQVIRELAIKNKIEIPGSSEELYRRLKVRKDCRSLKEYLKAFDLPLQCLKEKEDFRLAAYDLLRQGAEENVKYMEMRFAPVLSVRAGLGIRDIIEGVIDGFHQARKEFGIAGSAILCGMRHLPAEENIKMAKTGLDYLGSGVCGMDLAGDEAGFPPKIHAGFFRFIKDHNIPLTIHAGENGDPNHVNDIWEYEPARVGHGIALRHYPELRKKYAEAGTGIEMCPSSNLQTKAVERWVEYPLRLFMEEGLKVSVNTDNRTVTDTTLTDELLLVQQRFDLNKEELKQLMVNSIQTSFADDHMKKRLEEE